MSGGIHRRVFDWVKNNRDRSLIIASATVFFIVGVLLLASDYQAAFLRSDNVVERNTYGRGSRMERIIFQLGRGKKEAFDLKVEEQEYTSEEIMERFREISGQMETLIRGKNKSLDHVEEDLELISEIPGESIDVSWEIDRLDIINIYGEIQEENLEKKGIPVMLKATMTYKGKDNISSVFECGARIYPKTLGAEEQGNKDLIREILRLSDETRTKAKWALPRSFRELPVSYRRKMDKRGIILCGLAVCFIALGKLLEKERDKKKKEENDKQMRRDYPEIVNKLTLLMGSGMTVKRALKRIIEDYDKYEYKRKKHIAYEEIRYALRQTETGVSETDSYEKMGRRINLPEYMKLAALLSQNLRKGTKGLGEMLRIESIQAFEERKAQARRSGEEAGTKLLLPMFLMLAIVLVMVIVPAFLSLQL